MLGLTGSATAAVVFVGCEPKQSSSGEKMGCRAAGRDDRGDGFLLRGETRVDGRAIVDAGLNRSDIRVKPSGGSVREGVPLALTFNAPGPTVPPAPPSLDHW